MCSYPHFLLFKVERESEGQIESNLKIKLLQFISLYVTWNSVHVFGFP